MSISNQSNPETIDVKALELIAGGLARSKEILRQTRKWIERLLAVFRGEMPRNIAKLNETLLEKSSNLEKVMGEFGDLLNVPELDGEHLLVDYNVRVRDFNVGLGEAQSHELETLQNGLLSEVIGKVENIETSAATTIEGMFTEEQKTEIRDFADQIWEELFPESNVDKFAKWASGKSDLENYHEILLAPANGIEGVLSGVWNLARHPIDSYEDFVGAVDTISGMTYADFCACIKVLKFMYTNMDKKDLVAPSISFIVGCLFIFGGASKISKLMGGRKLPAALVELTGTLGRSEKKSSSLARAKEMPTRLLEELKYEHILDDLND